MGGFLSLVSVENIKLWKRFSSKIMIAILVIIVVGSCGIIKAADSMAAKRANTVTASTSDTDWKKTLKTQDVSLQQQIDTMEKSTVQSEKSSLDTLKMELAENEYRIENNMEPPKEKGFWDRVANFGLGSLVALLAIIACSGLVAGEFSECTMKTMISRPFARWQLLTAKFIAVFLYALVLMAIGYLVLLPSVAAFFGTAGSATPTLLWLGGSVLNVSGFAGSLISNGLDFLYVLVYLIFAFALCAIFRSRSLATGLSIFLMMSSSLAMLIADKVSWGKYIFFADTHFTVFLSGAPFYGITLGLALVICAVYCVGFLCAAYLTFAKRDIS